MRALQAAKEAVASTAVNKSSAVVAASQAKLAGAAGQLQELGARLAELPEEEQEEGAAAGEGQEAAAGAWRPRARPRLRWVACL
jgi:hypothetical protein